jgi:hypothetical protein
MDNLIVDLRLIKRIEAMLASLDDASFLPIRDELSRIYNRLYISISNMNQLDNESQLSQLLPDFLHVHPEIMGDLVVNVVQEVISYVVATCNYYATIKNERPLTPSEKKLGRNYLTDYLDRAERLLEHFRDS